MLFTILFTFPFIISYSSITLLLRASTFLFALNTFNSSDTFIFNFSLFLYTSYLSWIYVAWLRKLEAREIEEASLDASITWVRFGWLAKLWSRYGTDEYTKHHWPYSGTILWRKALKILGQIEVRSLGTLSGEDWPTRPTIISFAHRWSNILLSLFKKIILSKLASWNHIFNIFNGCLLRAHR